MSFSHFFKSCDKFLVMNSTSRENLFEGLSISYNDKTDALTLLNNNSLSLNRTVWAHKGRVIFGIGQDGKLRRVHIIRRSEGLSAEELRDGIRYRRDLIAR